MTVVWFGQCVEPLPGSNANAQTDFVEPFYAQPSHRGVGRALVLHQQGDGTDLGDSLGEALPSLRGQWGVGWG